MEDFKALFDAKVTELIDNHIADRQERISAIKALIDEYVERYAETPDAAQLERLSDYILHEELTDKRSNKVAVTEYPFFSERQTGRRHDFECSPDYAENYDPDGVNRSKPERRRRPAWEHRFVDKVSHAKNRRRKAQYKRDTSSGSVDVYNTRDIHVVDVETGEITAVIEAKPLTEPFVNCKGIGARWRDELSRVY